MKIKLSPFAEHDLDVSRDWYNHGKEGLGDEFVSEVSSIFERIRENPEQFPRKYKEMRKAEVKKFPFGIFFVVKNPIVYILGIFHSSRNPQDMKKRYKPKT